MARTWASPMGTEPRAGRPDIVWPLRRSWFVRRVVGTISRVCLVSLAVVAAISWLFVEAFGHPDVWAVVGLLFGAVPFTVLVLTLGARQRAAVAAGPGWIGVRVFGPWRTIDLGDVRAVRVADGTPGAGWGGGFVGARFGSAAVAGRSVVIEGGDGQLIDVGADAWEAGIGDVVRRGLGPAAVVDPGAGSRPGTTAGGDPGEASPPSP